MLRTTAKSAYLSIAGQFSRPSSRTHFLNGHYVDASDTDIGRQQDIFLQQLKRLSKFATLVNPAEALSDVHQCTDARICLTFDDGYEDVHSVIVPVLDVMNLKAIFFVNPAFTDSAESSLQNILANNYETRVRKKIMTKEMVRTVAAQGHEIGSHTSTHRRLDTTDMHILVSEIAGSKSEVERITGGLCRCFAYPFGGVNDLSEAALRLSVDTYEYVFSSIRSSGLFSFNGQVINRRHFEGSWPASHVNYFLAGRV
ncbi:MAG TPA: polysaccharide deacetylase family protein [Ohtaekwangia sp.]